MAKEPISHNIRSIRREQRITQEDLAKRCGLSRAGFRNIEIGKAVPRADTLRRIAEELGVGIQRLVAPVERFEKVRFRARKRLRLRESVLEDVGRRLRDISELEMLLDEKPGYKLEEAIQKIKKLRGRNRPIEAARRIRDALVEEDEVIRDIRGLLEKRAGIKILTVQNASNAFFGLSVADREIGPAIVVNTWDRISVERWIFTAAHELGHLVLHEGAYVTDEMNENSDEENEADLFAAHFLMPENLFDKEWMYAEGMDLFHRIMKVKRIFRVSYKTVLYRLAQENPRIWQIFYADFKRQFGYSLHPYSEPQPAEQGDFAESMRAQEPKGLLPIDFMYDRLHRLAIKALEAEKISISRGAEILGISVREMRRFMNDDLALEKGT